MIVTACVFLLGVSESYTLLLAVCFKQYINMKGLVFVSGIHYTYNVNKETNESFRHIAKASRVRHSNLAEDDVDLTEAMCSWFAVVLIFVLLLLNVNFQHINL